MASVGGGGDLSIIYSSLPSVGEISSNFINGNIKIIFSTKGAFAALDNNNSNTYAEVFYDGSKIILRDGEVII